MSISRRLRSPPKAWARACPARSSRREFLRNLGIEKRAAALKALASPEKAAEIDSAIKRLLGEGRTEMGTLFKAIGIAHPSLGTLPGFEPRAAVIGNAMLQAQSLSRLPGIRHGFFTRAGGVSEGLYESLNGGVGSEDAPAKVAENRARMAAAPRRCAGAFSHLLPDPFARRWWSPRRRGRRADRPRADAIVTRDARPRHRRLDRRLRTGAAGRSARRG